MNEMVSLQYGFYRVFSDVKSIRMFSHKPGKGMLSLQYGFSCASLGKRCAQIFFDKIRIRASFLCNGFSCLASQDYQSQLSSNKLGTFYFLLCCISNESF